jgi:hypothetical protein
MPSCIKCGGEMIGDGYTMTYQCEFANPELTQFKEPDANPVYCDYEDE